jgi:hypothetical protein
LNFWREGVEGRKIRSKLFWSIFNPTHHFVNLCLDILAVSNCFCQKTLWWEIWLVGSGRFLAKTHLRYLEVHTLKPSQPTSCVGTTKVKIMVSTRRGDYSTPEKIPPHPLERSPALRQPVTLVAFALPAAAAFGSKNYTVNKLAL